MLHRAVLAPVLVLVILWTSHKSREGSSEVGSDAVAFVECRSRIDERLALALAWYVMASMEYGRLLHA